MKVVAYQLMPCSAFGTVEVALRNASAAAQTSEAVTTASPALAGTAYEIDVVRSQRMALLTRLPPCAMCSLRVNSRRDNLKVLRVDTTAVRAALASEACGVVSVAEMIYRHALRYRSNPCFVGMPVRQPIPNATLCVASASGERAVAVLGYGADPRPTLTRATAGGD